MVPLTTADLKAWSSRDVSQSLATFQPLSISSFPCVLGIHIQGYETPLLLPLCLLVLSVFTYKSLELLLPLVKSYLFSASHIPPSLYFEYASVIIQVKTYFLTFRVFETDYGENGMNPKHHVG